MSDDFLNSWRFELEFKEERIHFQEITGLSSEAIIEEVGSSGESRFKYRLPTAAIRQNLVLRRAILPAGSKLADWCKNSIGGGLNKKVECADISVSLLGTNMMVIMKWVFHNAYPVKYSFSELNSQEDSLLIESIELAYTNFEMTENPK